MRHQMPIRWDEGSTRRVQRGGGPIEEIRPGEVVWIPLGEKHWHWASPPTAITHIAVHEQLDGKPVEWMERVSDEQYGADRNARLNDLAGALPDAERCVHCALD